MADGRDCHIAALLLGAYAVLAIQLLFTRTRERTAPYASNISEAASIKAYSDASYYGIPKAMKWNPVYLHQTDKQLSSSGQPASLCSFG